MMQTLFNFFPLGEVKGQHLQGVALHLEYMFLQTLLCACILGRSFCGKSQDGGRLLQQDRARFS